MNETFPWNPDFETGLQDVDYQHHKLVDLINKFGDLVIHQKVTEEDVVMLLAELTDYTHYHFYEEEQVMDKACLHPEYIQAHKKVHESFVNKLNLIKQHVDLKSKEQWESILDYLYHWLGQHILGMDMSMARQIELVNGGMTAKEALDKTESLIESSNVDHFLQALSNLIDLLAQSNEKLNQLNKDLEQQVFSRTEELEEANRKLQVLSLTDALTTLPNRRHAMEQLENIWAESEATQSSLSCMMIDADYFKEVNDQFGHDAGDKVLCELAKTLVHSMRNDDFVSRLGGDEFFIICPNTDLEGCRKIADSLLKRVKTMQVKVGDSVWHSSVSIGIAEKSAKTDSPDSLLKLADAGLYMAKNNGRGCVEAALGKE